MKKMKEIKLSRDVIYEKILDKLIENVKNQKIKPGEKLFSENQLASNLGISRAHVRDVYNTLKILGLVETRQGEGTFFKSNNDDVMYKTLFLMIHMYSTSTEEIMDVRKIIEIGMAEKAAINRNAKDVAEMLDCVKEMKTCTDGNRLSELDSNLHSTIARASGNSILIGLSRIISSFIIMSIREHWNYIVCDRDPTARKKTFEQHEELVNSIVSKKPYIAKVIAQEHLSFVERSLMRYYKKEHKVDST
jgi:GntR family transcriptional repressor for pyruvate dehydrogenase complex